MFTEDRTLRHIGVNFLAGFLEGTETESDDTFSEEDDDIRIDADQIMTTDAGSSEAPVTNIVVNNLPPLIVEDLPEPKRSLLSLQPVSPVRLPLIKLEEPQQ